MRKGWAVVLVVVLLAACGGSDQPPQKEEVDFADCGFPKPDPDADPSLVPEPLLLDGEAEVSKTDVKEGRLIGALNVRMNVTEAFDLYKEALAEADIDLLDEDNEGFEAELYTKQGKQLGQLQIRRSICDEAVIVYVNLPLDGSKPKPSGTVDATAEPEGNAS